MTTSINCYVADTVSGFACTMAACEDNCCRNTGWNIYVDPLTYEKYKNLDSDLGRHILDCIEKDEKGYKFKEFDHGHCPLLTEDGLCPIHRDLGAEHLCTTCAGYPRIFESFNGNIEHWLSLSCPDVVRWVLYRKKNIVYISTKLEAFVAPSPALSGEAEKFHVREFLIEVAQHKNFSLKEKLIFMGIFMRSLSKFPADDAIKNYRTSLQTNGVLDNLLSGTEAMHPDNRKDFFTMLAKAASHCATPPKVFPTGITNAEYYKLMSDFYNNVNDDEAKEYLVDAFDRLIVPYVNANSYVFDNYLTYSLVSSKFLVNAEDHAEAFTGFAGEFLSMLAFTAGLFHKNETLTENEMIAGIYLFHRRISHNAEMRKIIAAAFSNDILSYLLGALGGIK